MAIDVFTEAYYWIMNTPYYKMTVVKDMERIKTIIQKVTDTEKGKDIAIIDRGLKMAWWKMPELCFRDGKKFLGYLDIENAVPLIEDIKVETSGNLFIKEISITRLTQSKTEAGLGKSGKPKKFIEIFFPPTLLFQKCEAHFVKEVLKNPESKWAELKWVFIAACFAAVAIAYLLLQSGALNNIGS